MARQACTDVMPSPEGQPIDRLAPKEREGEPAPLRMLRAPRFQNRFYSVVGKEFEGKIQKRGEWLVCGAASAALARIIHAELLPDVPISRNPNLSSRIEVVLSLRDVPSSLKEGRGPDDHVHVEWYNGDSAWYIDPTDRLQRSIDGQKWPVNMRQWPKDTYPMRIESYPRGEIRRALKEEYGIYPINDVRMQWRALDPEETFLRKDHIDRMIRAFNGPDIVLNERNVPGYSRQPFFRDSVKAIIKELSPNWVDPQESLHDVLLYTTLYSGRRLRAS